MNRPSLVAGDEIGGYSVLQNISVNASESEVYVCEKSKRKYVLKYYIKEHTDIVIAGILLHCSDKNVVRFFDFGIYKNRYFEVIEYIKGGSLGDTDINGNYKYLPLNGKMVYKIIGQLNTALNSIHNKGIIHRDIKPENILYSPMDSRVCISDFGLSSIISGSIGLCTVPTRARTEGYAGPEIYSFTAGFKTDYYSLGITIWRLATGLDPFVYKDQVKMSSEAIHRFTVNGDIAAMLFKRNDSLNNKLKMLIENLLIVNYDERWSYEEVCDFLQSCVIL